MKTWKLALLCGAIALFGAMALARLPHALRGERIAGEVVAAHTGRPIAGVHIAYLWEAPINPSGFTGHNSRTICYHAAATVTDAKGRFDVPGWRKWSTYDVDSYGPVALVYARDYAPEQISLEHDRDSEAPDHTRERYVLKRFSGSAQERIDAMWTGIANRGCMYGGDSQKALYPMLKAIYVEAREIAPAQDQFNRVHAFALEAAFAALALDPNGPAETDKTETFIREELR